MDEYKYYQVPSPFPTLARGIFTLDSVPGEGKVDRIVIRGYDKFFNIGEVPWTTVCSFPIFSYQRFDLVAVVGGSRNPHRCALYNVTEI